MQHILSTAVSLSSAAGISAARNKRLSKGGGVLAGQ